MAETPDMALLKMELNQRKITIQVTPAQLEALKQIARTEDCDISALVLRGVDTFVATYRSGTIAASVESKIDRMHDHTVKLLVSIMKLIGQTLYFSSLPLTAGPVKAKLNAEGVSIQWHQSEKFALDLLKPPDPKKGESTTSRHA